MKIDTALYNNEKRHQLEGYEFNPGPETSLFFFFDVRRTVPYF